MIPVTRGAEAREQAGKASADAAAAAARDANAALEEAKKLDPNSPDLEKARRATDAASVDASRAGNASRAATTAVADLPL